MHLLTGPFSFAGSGEGLFVVVCVLNVLEFLMSLGSVVLSKLTIWISTLLFRAGRGQDNISGPTRPCEEGVFLP